MINVTVNDKTANVFARGVDFNVIEQLEMMLKSDITDNTKVSIMPDTHWGKGALVGTTIQLPKDARQWKVSPNVVGVDIGCGMVAIKVKEHDLDLTKVDNTIKNLIPAGFNHHADATKAGLRAAHMLEVKGAGITEDMLRLVPVSLGTLGGGNHFIDFTRDENDDIWLTIHTGSRNLGVQVASQYQKLADAQNPQENGLGYLTDDLLFEYLNDMTFTQMFAAENRKEIAKTILDNLGLTSVDMFDSIHNYIDVENGIIRKGATDATAGKRLIIPINMQFGSIIAEGKGNVDWNFSAPHGAGRVLGRNQAKKLLSMDDFVADMAGIYTTTATKKTIDESPRAYKKPEDIIEQIGDTVDIKHIIRPMYNFKG